MRSVRHGVLLCGVAIVAAVSALVVFAAERPPITNIALVRIRVTDMACLPESLAGRRYYQPTDQGFEARLRQRLEEIRKIQKKA